ncbi:MAG: outer membrane lipoprotein chaperone LolA [Myxococcales bacterium]|nr:outer membrane lipoprotein chaperone LolA [Myxococcales bacterium]
MNSLLLVILGLAQPAPPAAPASAAPASAPAALDVAAVVDGIQAFYASAEDFQASFTQTYTYQIYDRKQVSHGVVYFKKPRRMRWDYQKPTPKVFVADGATLWVYEPEESQVFKRDLKSAQLPAALSFMSGEGKLADEFDAKLLPSKNPDRLRVELTPKRHAGDYKLLIMEVDRATFAVEASTVVDPVGNTNHLVFNGVKTNQSLPDKGFQFSPPAGVKIITGGQ